MFLQKNNHENKNPKALSLVEVLVSVLILGSIFLFMLPVFIMSSRGTYQEKMIFTATNWGTGKIEDLREIAAAVYDIGPPIKYVWEVLDTLYGTSDGKEAGNVGAKNRTMFAGTLFDPQKSFIVIYPETPTTSPTPILYSKKIVVHMVWQEKTRAGTSVDRSHTIISYIGRPAQTWPRNPQTSQPTATATPTGSPTLTPTLIIITPTAKPTATQTAKPTATQTAKPTATATAKPTATAIPTAPDTGF